MEGGQMTGYSSHGYKSSLAVIKELELERGNKWFDDEGLDMDRSIAIWVTKNPQDAVRYLFSADIESRQWTDSERQLYEQALKFPMSFVKAIDLTGYEQVLDDGEGGYLYVRKVYRNRPMEAQVGMVADMPIPMEHIAEIGKMVKPKSMITYLGGKSKWLAVFEEDLIPLLNAKIKRNYALLDAFGGSGIVSYYFAMNDDAHRVRKIYYNDLNENTVNMLREIKRNPEKMMKIHAQLAAKFEKDPVNEFDRLKDISEKHSDPAVRATAYVLRMKASYMGKGANIPKQQHAIDQSVRKSFTAMEGIADWNEAFAKAVIWQKSFDDAIADFEKAEPVPRVIFCDPPYIGHKASDQYQAGFEHGLHEKLVSLIAKRRSTYVLTHSINPEFKQIYAGVLKERDWDMDVHVRYGNRGDNERQHETLSVWFAR